MMTPIAAIVAILIGILVAKPFLIYIGLGLFAVSFLIVANLSGAWWITLIVVIVIIIKFTGGKK